MYVCMYVSAHDNSHCSHVTVAVLSVLLSVHILSTLCLYERFYLYKVNFEDDNHVTFKTSGTTQTVSYPRRLE